MDSHLVISLVGANRLGLTDGIAEIILDCGCSIGESRLTVMGDDFAGILLVSGHWNAIAKLESAIPKMQERFQVAIQHRRTEPRKAKNVLVPYGVEVVALDRPGIVFEIANFFAQRQISVEDLFSSVYTASHTGAIMFSLHMTVGMPADLAIAAIRGEFMDFCDDRNLDAMLAPVK